MSQTQTVYMPARLSSVAVDNIHYELVDDDEAARTRRIEKRRWRLLQQATAARHPRHTYERSLL